jgi:hypothetical protein
LGAPLTASVSFRALELEHHHRFVPDNPRVVLRFNHIGIAGRQLSFGSIVVYDMHPAATMVTLPPLSRPASEAAAARSCA